MTGTPRNRPKVRRYWQGRLEASNINASEEAVNLITAGRHFEMMRRIASLIGDEMNGRAVEGIGPDVVGRPTARWTESRRPTKTFNGIEEYA